MTRALLIGVNNYKNPEVPDLNGCVNDVTNLRHVLITGGVPQGNISVITNSRAKYALIEKRFQWLAKVSKPDNTVIIQFSGHGSYTVDLDGDELERNPSDHYDEISCLYDMDWENNKSYITDDDWWRLLGMIDPAVNKIVILDTCHSGTGIRSIPRGRDHTELRPRFAPPPVDFECRRLFDSVHKSAGHNLDNTVLLAACRDDQTSADAFLNGSWNGAFTYYLCKALRDENHTTYSRLIESVAQKLHFNRFEQVPQAEGDSYRLVCFPVKV